MARKKQSRSEFRKHKRSGHPAYIYAKVGDEFIFLGITHAPITNGMKNIQLDTNPDPSDSSSVYVKRTIESDKANRFSDPYKGWKLSDSDKTKVNKIIKSGRKQPKKRKKKRSAHAET